MFPHDTPEEKEEGKEYQELVATGVRTCSQADPVHWTDADVRAN